MRTEDKSGTMTVTVRRYGLVTIPVELRRRFKIADGSILHITSIKEGILLEPLPPLKSGQVLSKEKHEKILRQLDDLRQKWR